GENLSDSRPQARPPAKPTPLSREARCRMQVIYDRCCVLDVHKKTVVACVLLTRSDGSVQRQVRTFSTMTAELLALGDWLHNQEVSVVAMESTGVFWHPVY